MTARPKCIDAARIQRTPATHGSSVDDLLDGLRLWQVIPPDPADLVNSPSARRMAVKQSNPAGTPEAAPTLSVSALGIDPLSCPRIGRDDDLASRKPHAGMPRSSPELPQPLDPGKIDRQLMRVMEAWAELPERTRKTIVALVSVARQRKD
jgi:hypothetical protein